MTSFWNNLQQVGSCPKDHLISTFLIVIPDFCIMPNILQTSKIDCIKSQNYAVDIIFMSLWK